MSNEAAEGLRNDMANWHQRHGSFPYVWMDDLDAALVAERRPLAQYAGALEAIIGSLPGKVTINGMAVSNEEGIALLRDRFKVDGKVIDQAALAANITADAEAAK